MFQNLEFFGQINSLALATIFIAILIGQALIVFFPKDAFMVFCGLLFGSLTGGLLNLVGLFGAGWLGYEIGNSGLLNSQKMLNHPVFVKTQKWLNKHGMKALLFGRIIPVMQYNIVSMTSGVTKLDRKNYLIINFITAIPYAFLFAFLGSNGIEYASEFIS